MFLGHPLKTGAASSWPGAPRRRRAAEALRALDPTIDPAAPIRTLKVAQRQIVEIARAVMEDAKSSPWTSRRPA